MEQYILLPETMTDTAIVQIVNCACGMTLSDSRLEVSDWTLLPVTPHSRPTLPPSQGGHQIAPGHGCARSGYSELSRAWSRRQLQAAPPPT